MHPRFDRDRLRVFPLSSRENKVVIERDHIPVNHKPCEITKRTDVALGELVDRIRNSKNKKRPVVMAFGAHTIKNGMAPTLIQLMKDGWLNHLATNGAGIIHDWEFAYQGESSEDVRKNVSDGRFGIWEETGFYINLAIIVGAWEDLGYGESVGKMIHTEGLEVPKVSELYAFAERHVSIDSDRASAAIDLAATIVKYDIPHGFMRIPHPFKKYSVQAAAYELNLPFTSHPMIGHDIIYNHPLNHGAAIGRTALRDFMSFAHNISQLEHGVYISIGSAVMSPMIFEKAFSMAQNISLKKGRAIENHFIIVADLAESQWDWQNSGEPPSDDPAYYLRYCKTFSRMGGEMRYVTLDNRDFLLLLHHKLHSVRSPISLSE
ncbi:MAG: hypothetical protein MI748_05895 [Opitutales bacterium]|nr:hypothetical protein [Opitutales bacterium]